MSIIEYEGRPFDLSTLTDETERDWLIGLRPEDVLRNAHRFYSFMSDQGIPSDSFTRELAFCKASQALGVDYDVLYDAWLNGRPVE